MYKRMLSVLLCFAMVLSFVAPTAMAEAVDFDIDSLSGAGQNTNADGSVITNDGNQIYIDENVIINDSNIDSPYAGTLPECDCGCGDADIGTHKDECVLKGYYTYICSNDAESIYRIWGNAAADAQAYIREYLGSTNQTKLQELEEIIKKNTPLSGEASTTLDGSTIDAIGIPEGGSVTVEEVESDDTLAEGLKEAMGVSADSQLFSWDISVQDEVGKDWQPDSSVQLQMQLDGVQLHKYTKVYIAHIDGNNVEYLPATVNEDGTLSFITTGFSTFVGFTVDFDYEGTQFSINGMGSVLLSELMDNLKVPLNVQDVDSVTFSDTTLISVTKQEGDWLLTSLKAFHTTEKLTLTVDGKNYDITVTDASAYLDYSASSQYYYPDSNGCLYWYADGDGCLANNDSDEYSAYDGWTDLYTMNIFGGGNLTIVIVPADYASSFKVNIAQIAVYGGTNVTIKLSDKFDNTSNYAASSVPTECIIRPVDDRTMFQVYDGSLTFQGNENTKLVIDGSSENTDVDVDTSSSSDLINRYENLQADCKPTADDPLVMMNKDSDGFSATNVIFRDGQEGALRCRSSVASINLNTVTFESTVKRAAGFGGAIYVMQGEQALSDTVTSTDYVQITSFTVDNCTFDGNSAERGGAIALRGKVFNIDIKNSFFKECKATHATYVCTGGAIYIDGSFGKANITNCEFTDCYSKRHGGAIRLESVQYSDAGKINYSLGHTMTIEGCLFDGCTADSYYGGGVSVQMQMATLNILSCEFLECVVNGEGSGAVAIASTTLPSNFASGSGPNWTQNMGDTEFGTRLTEVYSYNGANYTMIGNVNIKGTSNTQRDCTFTDCVTTNQAGAIIFCQNSVVNKATIEYVTIDGCKTYKEGSAIFVHDCYVKQLDLKNSTIQNCSFTTDENGNYVNDVTGSNFAGGTIRTIGATTCNLYMYNCLVKDNFSFANGGGLYWNANGVTRLAEGEECKAIVESCTFDNNTAGYNNYYGLGGGIFVEGVIEISKCEIMNNDANEGGGIMQNIYNNADREVTEGESTQLVLDSETKIYSNTAKKNGGGIALRCKDSASIPDDKVIPYSMTFTLGGAKVYSNTACQNGGGISFITEKYPNDAAKQAEVDRMTKTILLDSGSIYSNTSGYGTGNSGNGGGVYMDSSENTSLTITEGNVHNNTANNGNGGGIYLTGSNATCYITGGNVGGQFAKTTVDGVTYPIAGPNIAMPLITATEDADGNITTTYTDGNGGGIGLGGGAIIEMTGGTISYNQAYNGGGVSIDGYSTMEMKPATGSTTGGSVIHNSATNDGGGVWTGDGQSASVGNTFKITAGKVNYNTAGHDGGGIKTNIYSDLFLYGGEVSYNTSEYDGGGIHQYHLTECTISNCKIQYNKSVNGDGGGIHAYAFGKLEIMEGSVISYNTALDEDGLATDNFSAGLGGGIFARRINVTITGGSIDHNTSYYGGGVYTLNNKSDGDSFKVTISGGAIEENTAKTHGGGIYAAEYSRVFVTASSDLTVFGKIHKNTALNGGGIFATKGAALTVENGHITENTATGKPDLTTAYHMPASSLMGVGGGVFIGNDDDTADTTTFTLKGSNMAIVGNRADFAADDVFANGYSTQLSLPPVMSMNLEGYPFTAVGWVLDHPHMDTEYSQGINDSGIQEITDATNVYRYRESVAAYRILLPEDGIDADNADSLATFAPNIANEYAALTLGVPSAQKDTIVVDFGMPVDILVLRNDFGLTDGIVSHIGAIRPDPTDNDVDFTATAVDSDWSQTVPNCIYGKAEIMSSTVDGVTSYWIRYSPTTIQMTHYDAFSYAAQYTFGEGDNAVTYYFYSTVTVIPATSIYYEDNITDSSDNSIIKYSVWTLNSTTAEDGSVSITETLNTTAVSQWTDRTIDLTASLMQDENRVGSGNLYGGYDSNYYNYKYYSGIQSKRVRITETVAARANFTFTGTGFDVISACTNLSAGVMVTVTKPSDKNFVKYYFVDTYYGYSYGDDPSTEEVEDDAWYVNTDSETALYQVPVIKVDDLGSYDTYNVEIYVAYNSFFDHQNTKTNFFYLDGIRVYNPAGDGVVYEEDGTTIQDSTIRDAYVTDGEYAPTYEEMRNLIIDPNNSPDFSNGITVKGTLYIDGKGAVSSTDDLTSYVNYGPNNEVYLNPGDYIGFKLNSDDDVDKVQIALKRIRGAATVRIYGLVDETGYNARTITLNSATDMYYDLSDLKGLTVVIKNTSTSANGIVSITNVKTTHHYVEESGGEDRSLFTIDHNTAQEILSYINSIPVVTPTVNLAYPSVSFEDEIFYNVYFQVDDMTSVAQMGLITFDSRLENGTITDAKAVIPGFNAGDGIYSARSNGIPAKDMGDTLYFKVYAKLTDGTYVYSDIAGYNAIAYAKTILNGNSSAASKSLVVAMLNYGAAAQLQFGYKTDSLMNAGLTAQQQALVSGYSAEMMDDLQSFESSELIKNTDGFTSLYPSVTFEGAFAINFYAGLSHTPDSAVTLYYWDAATLSGIEDLTINNSTGSLRMTTVGDLYGASITSIAAKDMDKAVVAAIVYESNGVTYCSGPMVYSIGSYCEYLTNSDSAVVSSFAESIAVYGYYAKTYFAG